jgi:hypothetical protein
MKSKRKRVEEPTPKIDDLFDHEYELTTDLPSTFLEAMETESADTQTESEAVDDPEMKKRIKRLRESQVFDALFRLKRHDANARKFFAQKYGANSFKYIFYYNNYLHNYVKRKRLEEEYLRQSWNLMIKVGREKATEILDKMENFMEKIKFKDNS